MAGTKNKKKKRHEKTKSKKPTKRKRSKPNRNPAQGMTPYTALNNVDAVCSKYAGSREDHDNLKVSIIILKGQIESLVAARARIEELEEELADGEDEPDDEDDDDDDDDESEAE